MFKSKIFKYWLVILVSVILLTAGCTEKKDKKIKLGLMPVVDSLPFFVAEESGYFQDEGLDVELITFRSAVERDSALQANEINGAMGDTLSVAALCNSGIPTKIVSLCLGETGEEGRFAILASPGSGITEPSQLKNVPVAISTNTINEYVTDNLLADQGLEPQEIEKNAIPKISVRYTSLMEGKIKAACLPDPLAALAESQGAKKIIDDTSLNLSQTVIYFREDFIDKDSKLVTKLLNAYAKAAEDINENPAKYKALLVEKKVAPTEALNAYRIDHYPAPQLPDKKQVEKVVHWMLGKGLLKQQYSYEDLVREDLLPGSSHAAN